MRTRLARFRYSEEDRDEMRNLFYSRILSGHISNIEELQQRLRRYFEMHLESLEESENEEEEPISQNKNFMKEKEVNFRNYPFYINWKKLEANESGYYRVFEKYGYFGVASYSAFKEIYENLTVNNMMHSLASVVSEYLFNKEKTESVKKVIKTFFEKIPDLDKLYELIQNKILLIKEVPLIILVLKIYEIYFLLNDKKKEIGILLKYMYMIGNYLNDEEYKEIYDKNFKGKIGKIFKEVVNLNGKEYELSKTRKKFFAHIKYIYEKINKNNENNN